MYYKIINTRKLIATKAADLIGRMVFAPILGLKKGGNLIPGNIRKILIIRTAYIGDVILTLPILSPLKRLFPQAEISFLTTRRAKEILDTNPYVDKIISYDAFWFYKNSARSAFADYIRLLRLIRSESYDLVIEARGDIRDISLLAYLSKSGYRVSYSVGGGGFLLTHIVPFRKIEHKIRYHMDIAKYLGCEEAPIEWDMYLTGDEKHLAGRVLVEKGVHRERLIAAIHPGGRKELKRWHPEGFACVADRLSEEWDASVIILGGPDEVDIAKRVAESSRCRTFMLAGETTLRSMAAILERCDLFICNDSCALHIASMIGVPTVAIFGPSKSMETGPFGNIHVIVEKPFACRYSCDENICEHNPHNECLTSITPDDVFNAAHDVCQLAFNQEKRYDKPVSD
ncbi:MAG: hypothetical protein QG552_2971 [Thermodesulfobacteriota bacterium]|nr:hypothetical protein [Thermodesulfobacteriota bacterium]